MGEDVDALAPGVVVEDVEVERVAPLSPAEIKRAATLRALRAPVGRMLDILPTALAIRFNDKRMALSPQEREEGVQAWVDGLDVLLPELDRLLKVFALIGIALWTGSTALSRWAMVRECALRDKRAAQAAKARRDAEARGDEPADGLGDEPEREEAHLD